MTKREREAKPPYKYASVEGPIVSTEAVREGSRRPASRIALAVSLLRLATPCTADAQPHEKE